MLYAASPGWGLVLALAGWSLANACGGLCGCSTSLSYPGTAAHFGGMGDPSPILAEGPVGAVLNQHRPDLAASFCEVVPRQSWQRALWVLFPAIPDWVLMLVFMRWSWPFVAECPVSAFPRASWLGIASRFAGVGVPSPIMAEGPVGAVPRLSWLGPVARASGVAGVGCVRDSVCVCACCLRHAINDWGLWLACL